jgi:hypothetical protein
MGKYGTKGSLLIYSHIEKHYTNIINLLTESEGNTGKYPTEVLLY